MRKIFILTLAAVVLATTLSAQTAYEPPKGSPERKAILDALRAPIERDLKQKIVFVADNFKVQGSWAFIGGTPQGANGESPNYRGTRYYDAFESGAFDNNFFALLRDWTTRHRHSTAVTDDFTGLAANYADVSLRPLWDAWLYSTDVPPL